VTRVTSNDAEHAQIAELLSVGAVRAAAERARAWALAGHSRHFTLDESALPQVTQYVADVTRQTYPDLARIPYHSRYRHFGAGGVERLAELERALATLGEREALRARFDLVVTSVLLDAGAGPSWRYRDAETGLELARSEGLAVASLRWFMQGGLSSARHDPLRADAAGLERVTSESLAAAFQVSSANPLAGLEGRAELLRRLGQRVRAASEHLPAAGGARPGALADHLLDQTLPLSGGRLAAAVIQAFAPIWPGRVKLRGHDLGDVWQHSELGLVPFHKLSQWLTYSLVEPLEQARVRVVGLEQLTGLPEYRNGGLFVDGAVLVPKHAGVLGAAHGAGSDVVIEWRALTVALLDRVALGLRELWGMNAATLPLAKVLEGGTWAAGRQLAAERRPGGAPPLSVISDGTVF
jgi:hypothetical protein